ncbi:MAG TPA: DUF1501 domain-containing protein [Candidatus Methylacidiphilales bacterium]|nr:DUF1501 domain-containing protein [Candidatus Methylacidiphilales bacterium]
MNTFTTRRAFLRSTLLGGALSWTVPNFIANTFSTLHAQAADSATQVATGKDSQILVVMQLAGGNDGINTVIPYGSDDYYRARPKIGVAKDQIIKLNDMIGLNPALTAMKEMYDAGLVALVNGVGYPNPNRSHFRSTEIWHTGSDADKTEKYGWIGRYFDNCCSGSDPAVGINIGGQMPQAMTAKVPKGVSLDNPGAYRFVAGGEDEDAKMEEKTYRKMNRSGMGEMAMSDGEETSSGGSIGTLNGRVTHTGSPLDFIERTAMDAQVSSDKIRKLLQNQPKTDPRYPGTNIANSLRLISRLIAGGMTTRIYYLSMGGFDTHANQKNSHERLLKEFSEGVKAFYDDLKEQGNADRVTMLTFSEFGRRVAENGSGGTDHGAAAPMFLFGSHVKSGLHGTYPSLATKDLDKGDIKYTVDFRTVYASVLANTLKVPVKSVLGRDFDALPVIKT